MRPGRLIRSAIVLNPSTLLSLHRALTQRKYRRLFSSTVRTKPGPNVRRSERDGPADDQAGNGNLDSVTHDATIKILPPHSSNPERVSDDRGQRPRSSLGLRNEAPSYRSCCRSSLCLGTSRYLLLGGCPGTSVS
jgi:hypothetical protein